MRNTLETRLGIFFALAMLAAIITLEMVGGFERFRHKYEVSALFHNVMELKVGDPVKMAGVAVGRVQDVKLTNDMVRVTLSLNTDAQVRTDSKATIRFASMLGGQNYVSVDFGTPDGRKADPGAVLDTTEQPDMNVLLTKLDNVATGIQNITKSFSGDTINNLLGPFTDFMKQNSGKIAAILANVQNISDAIAQGQGTVGKLINDPEFYNRALVTASNLESTVGQAREMLGRADGIIDNVNAAVTNAAQVVQRINNGEGTLGRLSKDDKLYTETTEMMANLKEVSQKMNRGEGTVGKLINDDGLYKNAKLTLQKVDQATEGLEDQGPLSVLGLAAGKLF